MGIDLMRTLSKRYDYEQLRGVVIDILTEREQIRYGVGNYRYLVDGVTEVLLRRGEPSTELGHASGGLMPDDHNVELVRDIFWDLFRQGLITLGRNDMNDAWPNFRLSHNAKQTLFQASPYRFHNAASYLRLLENEVPDISSDATEYLQEAIATFYTDCLLASCVMLGVAAEIEFLRLIDAGLASPAYAALFRPLSKEYQIRTKIIKFQAVLNSLPKPILQKAGEDLEMHINSIQSVLRVARNKAGHALANRTPIREQVYVYLQMFVPFAGHLSRLRMALEGRE